MKDDPRKAPDTPPGGALLQGVPTAAQGGVVDLGAVSGALAEAFPHVPAAARGIVFICGLVVVLVGIISTTVVSSPLELIALMIPCALLLVGLALVYRLVVKGHLDPRRAEITSTWENVLDAIGGRWWQMVVDDEAPGLSELNFWLTRDGRCAIAGQKWNRDGARHSWFRTDVTALQRAEPISVFYYWAGSYAAGGRQVSGVGAYDFSPDHKVGTGWFTTGAVEERDFSRTTTVHLRRLTEAERQVLDEGATADVSALVRNIQHEWLQEFHP